jgi:DNA-binding HxlR family transcriptional regulator
MTRYAPGHRSHCPISFALDILGDRWTLLILRDLLMNGKRTYGELLVSEEGIATNVLADRLAWLEAHGILEKRRQTYRVTSKGLDLLPMMLEMVAWSAKYDPETAAPRAFVKRIAKARSDVLADLKAEYSKGSSWPARIIPRSP